MTIDTIKIPSGSIRSVAVVGGGASGAIVLDALIKQQAFDEVVVFEKREKVGGIWVLDEKKQKLDIRPGSTGPELDPSVEPPAELDEDHEVTTEVDPENPIHSFTPSYRGMRTKTSENVMTFSDIKKWPKLDKPGFDRFTKGIYVQDYLESYIQRYPSNIQLNTSVEKVTKRDDGKYNLYLRKVNGDGSQTWSIRTFDTYIIATGEYHVPYIPEVPGLQEVYLRFPERLQHSKSFQNTAEEISQYNNKTVLTVGGRPSASDFARFIEKNAKVIYSSIRSPQRSFLWETSKIRLKPIITGYKVYGEGFDAYFEDGSVLHNPDFLVYCTGYQKSYPFLPSSVTTGLIVPDVYQHIFSIADPNITFIGLPSDGLNLRCLEYQAILIARYLAGLVNIPSKEEQIEWCRRRLEKFGDSRLYHTIGLKNAIAFSEALIDLGGGIVNGPGRHFPILTEDDILENERDKLVFKQDFYLFESESN